jgi:hypothetical protein
VCVYSVIKITCAKYITSTDLKQMLIPPQYLMTTAVNGELVLGMARALPEGLKIRGSSIRGLHP